jgi:hypothetical protein
MRNILLLTLLLLISNSIFAELPASVIDKTIEAEEEIQLEQKRPKTKSISFEEVTASYNSLFLTINLCDYIGLINVEIIGASGCISSQYYSNGSAIIMISIADYNHDIYSLRIATELNEYTGIFNK